MRAFLYGMIRRLLLGKELSGQEFIDHRIEQYRAKGATIGKNVRLIGRLDGLNPHLVTIGDNCVIGARSALLTHCAVRGAQPVVIEDEVWVGYNAIILPGVTVHAHSVIGAGAVVTRDVPPRSVAAGNPARVLRELTEEELLRLSRELREYRHIGQDPDKHASGASS